jgi:hypothetical protein
VESYVSLPTAPPIALRPGDRGLAAAMRSE